VALAATKLRNVRRLVWRDLQLELQLEEVVAFKNGFLVEKHLIERHLADEME
jgi:hypothetical protein